MCGIIVSSSEDLLSLSRKQYLNKRGPDQSKEIITDGITFSFHRLAIMDLNPSGMQPFQYMGCTLVANAEIYNYKEIKEQLRNYSFKGSSDCEVLLPLYKEIGVELFQCLDAEFAIVLYDANKKQLVAARDPIGIRPLFYGYHKTDGKIIFASEVKAMIGIVKEVYPFPPGHVYINGVFKTYHKLYDIDKYHNHSLDEITKNIKTKLINAVTKRLDSDAPMGFLLSGGLDSSLVCSIASKYLKKPIRTFSIGMEKDPIDLKYATQVSNYLGTEHTEVKISKKRSFRITFNSYSCLRNI